MLPEPMSRHPLFTRSTGRLLDRAQPAVAGIVEAVIAAELRRDNLQGVPHIDATAHDVLGKIAAMPPHLSAGMLGLVLLFEHHTGRRASAMSLPERQALLAKWRQSPIGPLRQLVQFYEKMGTFIFYSHVEEELMPPVEVR